MGKFVTNAWYPAGWSRDFGRSLTRRKIIGDEIVLYRAEAGSLHALEDVCPHRLLPLSYGRLKGDAVECGYHGLTFDCGGRCVRVPGQDVIPRTVDVRAYPVEERMGIAWIWMGAPALANPADIFDLPQFHDPAWSAVEGDALAIGANYLSLADNLCDPSHVSWVHRSTLGNEHGENVPVKYEVYPEQKKVVTWRWIIDAPAIPIFQKFGGFGEHVDRWHYYHYHAPSIAVIDFGTAHTGKGAPEGRRDDCVQIYACHFITPVDENHSIDHWMHVKNFHTDDATDKAICEQFRLAFSEDKVILEAIEATGKRLPDRRPVRLAIDASPMRMRKMVSDMIADEVAA